MYPVGQGSSAGPPGPGPVGPPSSNNVSQHTGGWGGTIGVVPQRDSDPLSDTATTISGGLGTTGIGLGIGPVIGTTPNPLSGLSGGDSPPGTGKNFYFLSSNCRLGHIQTGNMFSNKNYVVFFLTLSVWPCV